MIETEMIEHVAFNLYCTNKSGQEGIWEHESDYLRSHYRKLARAAIKAIREMGGVPPY